jgi:MFS family permease
VPSQTSGHLRGHATVCEVRLRDDVWVRSASFRLLLVSSTLATCGYSLLLSVVPLWLAHGGSGAFGAGVSTAVFMLATVATQLGVPWLLRRSGHRALLGASLGLLGLPAPLLGLSGEPAPVLGLCALRGIGFGLFSVVGNALVAELVPADEHGRATARYGTAVAVPQLVLLPAGVVLVGHLGFGAVFAAGAVPLLGLLPLSFLQPRPGSVEVVVRPGLPPGLAEPSGTEGGLSGGLVGPLLAMASCAVAQGGLITFLPLASLGAAGGLAVPVALLGTVIGSMVGRLVSGQLVDGHGLAGRLLRPGMLLAGLGMVGELLATGVTGLGAAVLLAVGAVAVGVGFGLVQNDSLVSMFAAEGPARYGTASAAWNSAYDTGTGVGAVGLGALAQPFGFRVAFGASAVLLALAVPFARRRVR